MPLPVQAGEIVGWQRGVLAHLTCVVGVRHSSFDLKSLLVPTASSTTGSASLFGGNITLTGGHGG
ncbi:MAG: hypothetical protein QOJ11_3878 [Frankiales bacterium]|jgi:hypothetical protein|nr:hypothetical protein [Frankiales bacterium]